MIEKKIALRIGQNAMKRTEFGRAIGEFRWFRRI
jgi:hypothetical protein